MEMQWKRPTTETTAADPTDTDPTDTSVRSPAASPP